MLKDWNITPDPSHPARSLEKSSATVVAIVVATTGPSHPPDAHMHNRYYFKVFAEAMFICEWDN